MPSRMAIPKAIQLVFLTPRMNFGSEGARETARVRRESSSYSTGSPRPILSDTLRSWSAERLWSDRSMLLARSSGSVGSNPQRLHVVKAPTFSQPHLMQTARVTS